MGYEFRTDFEVGYSNVDSTLHLSLVSASQFLQELATGIFQKMGVSYETIADKYHAGWVLMRANFLFDEMPVLGEQIKACVYPTALSATFMRFEAVFEKKDGKRLFGAVMETCLIDIRERRSMDIKQIAFPEDLAFEKEQLGLQFSRMNEPFEGEQPVYEQQVYASDIDYNQHVNNIHYVRYLLNAFPNSFWENIRIREFEIKYLRESLEGQILEIYQKESENTISFLIQKQGQNTVRAKMIYES